MCTACLNNSWKESLIFDTAKGSLHQFRSVDMLVKKTQGEFST